MGSISDECELRYHISRAMRLDCISYRKRKYYMYLLNVNYLLPSTDFVEHFHDQKDMLSRIESNGIKKFTETFVGSRYVT